MERYTKPTSLRNAVCVGSGSYNSYNQPVPIAYHSAIKPVNLSSPLHVKGCKCLEYNDSKKGVPNDVLEYHFYNCIAKFHNTPLVDIVKIRNKYVLCTMNYGEVYSFIDDITISGKGYKLIESGNVCTIENMNGEKKIKCCDGEEILTKLFLNYGYLFDNLHNARKFITQYPNSTDHVNCVIATPKNIFNDENLNYDADGLISWLNIRIPGTNKYARLNFIKGWYGEYYFDNGNGEYDECEYINTFTFKQEYTGINTKLYIQFISKGKLISKEIW